MINVQERGSDRKAEKHDYTSDLLQLDVLKMESDESLLNIFLLMLIGSHLPVVNMERFLVHLPVLSHSLLTIVRMLFHVRLYIVFVYLYLYMYLVYFLLFFKFQYTLKRILL